MRLTDDAVADLRCLQKKEYIGIVLANSVYPTEFPVDHEFNFDGDLKELELTVTIPPPEIIPTVRHVKFVVSTKELKTTDLPKTEQKTRYNNAVFSVALRTLHEVFEADRRGHVESISLRIQTKTIDPSTGHKIAIPFVFAAAEREQFMSIRLSHIEVVAALEGINASLSKNPFGGVPAPSSGLEVRG